MEQGLEKLRNGDFNHMSQEPQPDGSVVITLHKRGEKQVYKFRVKNLYQEDEEILEHNVLDSRSQGFSQDRRNAR